MKRKILVATFMLVSIAALGLPASNAGDDLCRDCALQCVNEAWYVLVQCYRNGGTNAACQGQSDQYMYNCNAVFCNYGIGCDLPTRAPIKPIILP